MLLRGEGHSSTTDPRKKSLSCIRFKRENHLDVCFSKSATLTLVLHLEVVDGEDVGLTVALEYQSSSMSTIEQTNCLFSRKEARVLA